MRIALVTPVFPPQEGGIQRYLHHVARCFSAEELFVLTTSYKHEAETLFDAQQPFDIQRVPFLPHRTPWYQLLHLVKAHRRQKFDLVLISTPILGFLVGLPFHLVTRVPFAYFAYGTDVTQHLSNPLGTKILKVSARMSAGVIAVSQYTRGQLVDLGVPSEKLAVVLPAVDERFLRSADPEFTRTVRQRYSIPQVPLLLTASRLARRKGHTSVLESLPIVLDRIPNVVYVVVGRGHYRSQLESMVRKLNVEDHVRFLGYVPDEELTALYHACDVFVMPSQSDDRGDVEGFGIVYLEAGACGCPVVGGQGGGVEEAVSDGETGILVTPGDHEEIAQAILTLLQNPRAACRMGRLAMERVRAHFTRSAMKKRIRQTVRDYLA